MDAPLIGVSNGACTDFPSFRDILVDIVIYLVEKKNYGEVRLEMLKTVVSLETL